MGLFGKSKYKKEKEKEKQSCQQGKGCFSVCGKPFCHEPAAPEGHAKPKCHLPDAVEKNRTDAHKKWQRLHQVAAWMQHRQREFRAIEPF